MTSREIDTIPEDVQLASRMELIDPIEELSASSSRIWEVGPASAPLLYTGIIEEESTYLWLLLTREFELHPIQGFRAALHYLNYHMREQYPFVWCLVDARVPGCTRLAELAGFRLRNFILRGTMPLRVYTRTV